MRNLYAIGSANDNDDNFNEAVEEEMEKKEINFALPLTHCMLSTFSCFCFHQLQGTKYLNIALVLQDE